MNCQSVKLFFLFQIITVILIVLDFLPREFSFVLTAFFLVYILIGVMQEALLIVIMSIPLFIALPISAFLDSMANWRIIIMALFLKWLIGKAKKNNYQWPDLRPEKIKEFLRQRPLIEKAGIIFLFIALFSLIGAESVGIGVKKIIFLANIFLLYILVKNIADTPDKLKTVIKISSLSAIFVLIIGYVQLFSVFFISLYDFWQYWAANIIPVFYGENLGRLLAASNTWFSYYGEGIPPTLRMFSVFPDSHSFALFNIVSVPFLLALAVYFKSKADIKKYRLTVLLVILSLFAVILSGSRGAWVGAIMPLILSLATLTIVKFSGKEKLGNSDFLIKNLKLFIPHNGIPFAGKLKNFIIIIPKIVTVTFIIFFLSFPISSVVLNESQKAEFERLNDKSGKKYEQLSFKRFASVIDVTETSNKGRIEIWKDTLNSIKKHPILGIGFGNFPIILEQDLSTGKKGASAHNIYLDIWAETGILGLAMFLLIFYEIGKTAYGVFRDSNDEIFKIFGAAVTIYLIWILGYGLFDVVLFNDKVLMLFTVAIGLLYGLADLDKKKPLTKVVN